MGNFKAWIILPAIIFFCISGTYSQSFSNEPGDTIKMQGYLEDLNTLTIIQQNNTSDTLNLKWEKISAELPAKWEASVCDNKLCYPSLVDSGEMNPVAPNDNGILYMKITPHTMGGEAVIRYTVWDEKFPVNKDTLTFILLVKKTGFEDDKFKNIHIYPNPASGIVTISNIAGKFPIVEIQLFNSTGKQVNIHPRKVGGLTAISLAGLPGGVYFIRGRFEDQVFIKKIIKE